MAIRKTKLTTQERRFCRFYLECWNLGQAYLRAGYEPEEKNARQCAYQLFHKPHIQEYWQKIVSEADEQELAKAKNIIVRLNEIANADIKDFLTWKGDVEIKDQDGNIYMKGPSIQLADSEDVDGTLITEISFSEKDGFKFKLEPRMQAIQLLAKIRGLLVDKSEAIVKNVDLSSLSNEQLERLASGEPIEKVLLSGN